MLIQTLSTFPHMYDSVMGESMMKRAQESGILSFEAFDLRDWTYDRHRTTDDYPYGGGAGLVMKCEPVFEAVEDILHGSSAVGVESVRGSIRGNTQSLEQSSALRACGTRFVSTLSNTSKDLETSNKDTQEVMHGDVREPLVQGHTQENIRGNTQSLEQSSALRACGTRFVSTPSNAFGGAETIDEGTRVVFLSPVGRTFDDDYACELAQSDRILFVCGHYEGMDERVYTLATDIISLGDYVLTSGELASMVVIDAVVRKLPGVLGAENGADDESFAHGLLEYPQYTRPAEFRGMAVPDVLLSGHHANIEAWRRKMSLKRTAEFRPDLIRLAYERGDLSSQDVLYLESLNEAPGESI